MIKNILSAALTLSLFAAQICAKGVLWIPSGGDLSEILDLIDIEENISLTISPVKDIDEKTVKKINSLAKEGKLEVALRLEIRGSGCPGR